MDIQEFDKSLDWLFTPPPCEKDQEYYSLPQAVDEFNLSYSQIITGIKQDKIKTVMHKRVHFVQHRSLALYAATAPNPSPYVGHDVVYFLYGVGTDRVKIGHSRQPQARFNIIATQSPVALKLIAFEFGARDDEQALHARFSSSRRHGEWFQLSGPVIDYLLGLPFGENIEALI